MTTTSYRILGKNTVVAGRLLVTASMMLGAAAAPTFAQPYDPPDGSPAYWQTPGFKNFRIKGPADARGVLFWSHGVRGKHVQWKSPPAKFIKYFASNGWDIIKINRNNLHECGWTCSGVKHVADLQERARKARSEGYKHVIAAGQSYGGAISLEAATEPGLIDAVIAAAPGHGSDACGTGTGAARYADSLTDDLVRTISNVKSPRIVLTMADGDECMGFNNPTDALRAALEKTDKQFVFLDASMPIRGHGAARTNQFDEWYRLCLLDFLLPDNKPTAGETKCSHPTPVPRYLTLFGFELPERPADKPHSLIGGWSGEYSIGRGRTRNICVAIYDQDEDAVFAYSFWGAGRENKLSMHRAASRRFAKNADEFVYRRGKYLMKLSRTDDLEELGLYINTVSGREFEADLKRGCRLH